MNLFEVSKIIEIAMRHKPPLEISTMTGEYYQPYYYLMYLLARHVTKGTIIELGVSKGYGVNSFAFGNPNIRIIGLDLNVLPEFIAPNVDFHLMSALPVPAFIESNISILHIDTEHSYSNAKQEFEAYESYLLPGAVVMFDDLHAMDDGVLKAFYELPYAKIQDDRLHPINGYGLLIYE